MRVDLFSNRHIGADNQSSNEMLSAIGVQSLEELIEQTIPDDIIRDKMNLDVAMSENEYLNHMRELADKNQVFKTYIGLGYHATVTPSVIKRNILENPGWYTAYTPYQAEIAQGRLEALLNYQTMVMELTGMEIANASLLDESTAAAEAMTMVFGLRSREQKKNDCNKFFISEKVLPQTIAVLKTKAKLLHIELVVGEHQTIDLNNDFFGVLVQYPGKNGIVYDYKEIISKAKLLDIKTVFAADIMSLVLLKSPGSLGADVVVGTTQRFGVPLGYGGPHAAFFATKEAYKRFIPGRIIGVTKDIDGKPALRMALQTREQHIKRDKATSNVCTAQVLLAVMASMYAVYHGPKGLKYIASGIHNMAVSLADTLTKLGLEIINDNYFDTLIVKASSKRVQPIAEQHRVNFLYISEEEIGIAINETSTLEDIQEVVTIFAKALDKESIPLSISAVPKIETVHLRTDDILEQKVFNSYHSETSLMRYIKKLERKDLSLNHSMIALGSCTMKLNAASEMLPLSLDKWASIHPFVPIDQAQGYQQILSKLEEQLSEITGFAATTLQPNSGAQGEYTGLVMIYSYLESIGQGHRKVCLIPASAHGTNPASAVLAGMKIVVVKSTPAGNIDVEDLEEKAKLHQEDLAALMVTYPSTHGVFESSIKKITSTIHQYGGQVYMDGANMNAQVGYTSPAHIGADVCHLNLHKTFAIPHGGGGPGVGPVCVAEHLAPFLPANPVVATGGTNSDNYISSAPWGSALVCLISYGYIRMLGVKGLTKSTAMAILNANYIKHQLENHFEILYTGERGRVAHEMIVDFRPFKEQNIEVVDIAKRLMDYGFHAPTVSFPVAGTLMIEPTESEDKQELDRFCEALISIRKEIETSPKLLKNAPHTLEMLTSQEWSYDYTRQQAAFALPYLKENKFWPAIRRVDDAYGDRNLVCSCTPIEDYMES